MLHFLRRLGEGAASFPEARAPAGMAVATDHGQVLIPFVVDVVPVVDLESGFIEVVEMEGLFDAD